MQRAHLAGLRDLARDQPGPKRRIVVCLAGRPRLPEDGIDTLPAAGFAARLWGERLLPGSLVGRAGRAVDTRPARANNRGTVPRGNQLERQWRLLQLIDRPAGVTVDDAAGDLGCTRRTIFRDLRVLQNACFPIYDDRAADGPRTVWRVSEGFKQKLPLRLTLDELAALLMSEALLAPAGASLLGPSVAAAFDRIRGVLSRDALALLARMREAVGVRALGAKLQQPAAELLPAIHAALAERRTLRVRYHTFGRDEDTERELDPYHLTYYDGGLYLVAHCHLRHDVRVFAVERFQAVQPTRRRFEAPAGFDVRAFLDRALGIVQGELVTVRVAFAPALARYVRDRLWHPSQRMRDLPDGRLEMTLRVADTPELRRWLLGYGVQAEVLEPASIREALRAEAEALAARLVPTRRPLARGPAALADLGAPPGRSR